MEFLLKFDSSMKLIVGGLPPQEKLVPTNALF